MSPLPTTPTPRPSTEDPSSPSLSMSLCPAVSSMSGASSDTDSQDQPTWRAVAHRRESLAVPLDRAMDKGKRRQWDGSRLPSSSRPPRPPDRRLGSIPSNFTKPPIFGSTSRKQGMDEEMARLNHSCHQVHSDDESDSESPDSIYLASGRKLPSRAKNPVYQHITSRRRKCQTESPSTPERARPLRPSSSELREILREDDAACRRESRLSKYWVNDEHRDNWQLALVTRLVHVKHAQLDKTQHPLLCCARYLVHAEEVELWYRHRELRAQQEKERAKKGKKACFRLTDIFAKGKGR
ncbi:hypothetical protein F4804DRAFT_335610 [Jackrogersella minutella]|nr:hypothetical protein F4804DRAFT_335610 [Jackrogersella minutella]